MMNKGIAEEVNLMQYAYETLGKNIKEIFDVMVEKYGHSGKYVFLEFAKRNFTDEKFQKEYMNTCFI